MQESDKIGNLFREAFRGQAQKMDTEELESMNQLISKRSFFRFTLNNFNIFYVAGIAGSLVLCLGLIYQHTAESTENNEQPKTELIRQLQSDMYDSLTHTGNKIDNRQEGSGNPGFIQEKKKIHVRDEKKPEEKTQVDTSTILSSTVTQQKSNQLTTGGLDPGQPKTSVKDSVHRNDNKNEEIIRETIVIKKRDTIYQIDTLKAKNSRKRKKW